jgi:hypothetical protein
MCSAYFAWNALQCKVDTLDSNLRNVTLVRSSVLVCFLMHLSHTMAVKHISSSLPQL